MKKFIIEGKITILLCICGFTINFIAFYPGFMQPDTLDQYTQSITGNYTSWHPPGMAYFWHILNYIYQGPQIMLAFQLILLWSCYLLFAALFRNNIWRVTLFLFFLIAPFIQNFSGYIVKDTQMALSWFLATAILFYILNNSHVNKISYVILGFFSALLILYGDWVRYNALPALLPLCILWAYVIFKNEKMLIKFLYGIILLVIVGAGQGLFTHFIIKTPKSYTEAQIYFHDLNGIFVKTHQNVYPGIMYTNKDFDTAYIRGHYKQGEISTLLYNPDNKNLLPLDEQTTTEMKKAWLDAIQKYPHVYLQNRWDIYLDFLTFKKEVDIQYFFPWIQPNNYGFKINTDNYLYAKYIKYMYSQKNQIYFKVWFWIFLNILLFPALLVIKNKKYRVFYLCLVLSGFLYTLPQFFVSNSINQFRYIYWSCIACTIAMIVLIADRIKFRKWMAK
jgi:hypothetical protein